MTLEEYRKASGGSLPPEYSLAAAAVGAFILILTMFIVSYPHSVNVRADIKIPWQFSDSIQNSIDFAGSMGSLKPSNSSPYNQLIGGDKGTYLLIAEIHSFDVNSNVLNKI